MHETGNGHHAVRNIQDTCAVPRKGMPSPYGVTPRGVPLRSVYTRARDTDKTSACRSRWADTKTLLTPEGGENKTLITSYLLLLFLSKITPRSRAGTDSTRQRGSPQASRLRSALTLPSPAHPRALGTAETKGHIVQKPRQNHPTGTLRTARFSEQECS